MSQTSSLAPFQYKDCTIISDMVFPLKIRRSLDCLIFIMWIFYPATIERKSGKFISHCHPHWIRRVTLPADLGRARVCKGGCVSCLCLWYVTYDNGMLCVCVRFPFHKGFMSSYSKSLRNLCYPYFRNTDLIRSQFCTCSCDIRKSVIWLVPYNNNYEQKVHNISITSS